MTSKHSLYIYSWHLDKNNDNYENIYNTNIRIYGIDEKNNNICLKIKDFYPYCYVEIPDKDISGKDVKLDKQYLTKIINIISGWMATEKHNPIKTVEVLDKKKLYYAHIDTKTHKHKTFKFLKISFVSDKYRRNLKYLLEKAEKIRELGNIRCIVHEYNADPLLQYRSIYDIPSAGWVVILGEKEVKKIITNCDFEYKVSAKNIKKVDNKTLIPKAKLLSFDIEVYSDNPNKMPRAEHLPDEIFQISCVIAIQGDTNSHRKILLTLGTPDKKEVGDDIEVREFKNESKLLIGFTDLINKENPNILMGYNIFMFDNRYMYTRSNMRGCFEYLKQGFLKEVTCEIVELDWASSAYGTQKIYYLETEGRIFVDLLPVIRRDYNLDNYKLKTVSTLFIGATKDPLTHKDIFKSYEDGVKFKTGNKSLGVCGKYCVQDSYLVLKLFEKLQLWYGLTEQANIFNVPIPYLYTKGQQIKVYSQIYKLCIKNSIVLESDVYKVLDTDFCQGASVLDVIAGIHNNVTSFDFQSLYPSIIIAYNIDPTTLLKDDVKMDDNKCNIIEWEEHLGCQHDKKIIRKMELTSYIDKEQEKINKEKEKFVKTKKKDEKQEIKNKINDMKLVLKPYQQERSILLKHKPKHILCSTRRYRWLKEPKGLYPTLLNNLLDARKKTRNYIKELEKKLSVEKIPEEEKESIRTNIVILDKRQLAYKISANSMYGSMGVRKGFIPFMVGAMCVTAIGRKNINIAATTIREKYGGTIIYGDTDSNYVVFPEKKTYKEIWDWSTYVSAEVSKLFPSPIKLEFEQKIYALFLLITKKRYMYLELKEDNSISQKIGKKGVLLARRDNAAIIREIYSKIVLSIFDKHSINDLHYILIQELNKVCGFSHQSSKFVITKSVKSVVTWDKDKINRFDIVDDKKDSVNIGNYKVKKLSNDDTEKKRQLELKDCDNEEDYYLHSLGAHIQLAEKIRKRGGRVDIGERLEYVLTANEEFDAKQYKKIEAYDYFRKHGNILRIDYLFYIKQLVPSIDQLFNIMITDKQQNLKDFVKSQLKLRLLKQNMLNELKVIFSPRLVFMDI